MARRPELLEFARRFRLPIITVGQLVTYRKFAERPAAPSATCLLPTASAPSLTSRLSGQQRQRTPRPGLRAARSARADRPSGPGAQRVPDRGGSRLPTMRLRSPTSRIDEDDRIGRFGSAGLPPRPRRSGHRARAPRSPPTRCRTTASTPSTPISPLACRPTLALITTPSAILKNLGVEPGAAGHQQPRQMCRVDSRRNRGSRAGGDDAGGHPRKPRLPEDQEPANGPPHRRRRSHRRPVGNPHLLSPVTRGQDTSLTGTPWQVAALRTLLG